MGFRTDIALVLAGTVDQGNPATAPPPIWMFFFLPVVNHGLGKPTSTGEFSPEFLNHQKGRLVGFTIRYLRIGEPDFMNETTVIKS